MMINLAGYEITNQIHESNNSLVYRGLRKQDNQPIILKFLKLDYPLPASLVRTVWLLFPRIVVEKH